MAPFQIKEKYGKENCKKDSWSSGQCVHYLVKKKPKYVLKCIFPCLSGVSYKKEQETDVWYD